MVDRKTEMYIKPKSALITNLKNSPDYTAKQYLIIEIKVLKIFKKCENYTSPRLH